MEKLATKIELGYCMSGIMHSQHVAYDIYNDRDIMQLNLSEWNFGLKSMDLSE